MSFSYSTGSVPICDPKLPHHQCHGNSFLPHRACYATSPVSTRDRMPLANIGNRNRYCTTPVASWKPSRRVADAESPVIGYYSQPQVRSRIPETPSRTRLNGQENTGSTLKISKSRRLETISISPPRVKQNTQQCKPTHVTNDIEMRPSQRHRDNRIDSAPARLHFERVDVQTPTWSIPRRPIPRRPVPTLQSTLNKPLPEMPLVPEASPEPRPRLDPSPVLNPVAENLAEKKLQRHPKVPPPLRLFPVSPTNSFEAANPDRFTSSPTDSLRPSWYLTTPQVSVFEDDEEKTGLIAYLKWPLQAGKVEGKSRRRKLKSRSSGNWKSLLCFPCGRIG